MTRKDLLNIDYRFHSPFQITLADNTVVYCEKVIRIVPERRLVAFGTWNDQAVVVKLLYSSRAAEQFAREVKGVKCLAQNKVPTPILYFADVTQDKQVYALIFERIFNASCAEELLRATSDSETSQAYIRAIITELATQHALGILQQDLHLKNFLMNAEKIFTLDGADIEISLLPVQKEKSLENLALLLSQLSIAHDHLHEPLFRMYAKLRGWLLKDVDVKNLKAAVNRWRKLRWQRYQKKIFRSCSQFECIKTWPNQGMLDRHYAGDEFNAFIHNPEAIFNHANTRIIKAGRSATVAKVQLDNKIYVIKRNNIKNVWHGLRRCLRHTRAKKSWYLSLKLHFFGVPTAQPVAYLEKNYCGLKGKSYFVMEYVDGVRGDEFFHQVNDFRQAVERILFLITQLAQLRMTHGDLKITNFFIDDNAIPTVIDLDGMQEHKFIFSLRCALNKEIRRFFDNFRNRPMLYKKIVAWAKEPYRDIK